MSTEYRECCICYEEIGTVNNCTTECGHLFCFKCLATAMHYNNACPYCRSKLVDLPEEEVESEYEDDDDDDDEDEEDEDLEDEVGHIEDIVERLEKSDIRMIDVVSMLINRYSKKDEKYTEEHIMAINLMFDQITSDVDTEVMEQKIFAAEDLRSHEVEAEMIVFRARAV